MGLLTRRTSETVGYITPTREIAKWVEKTGARWILDPSLPVPSHEELVKVRNEIDPPQPEIFDMEFDLEAMGRNLKHLHRLRGIPSKIDIGLP